MTLNYRKLNYLASYDKNKLPGVHLKIEDTVKAAMSLGYESINIQNNFNSEISKRELFNIIIKSNAKTLIFRSNGWANILFFPAIIIARLQGKKVLLEMPTPRKAIIKEKINMLKANQMNYKEFSRFVFLHLISGPWALWPFNKVLQNGDESYWFMIGNKNRTIKLGNGIDPNRYQLRNNLAEWPSDTLYILGVSRVSFYNGYDRVIKAINIWNKINERKFDVIFKIVGNGGSELSKLKKLVVNLGVEDYVMFEGFKTKQELMEYYSKSHLAVSSIGIHRWGLKEASVLKAREYCLVGIPFIASGQDIDFTKEQLFRFQVNNSDSFDGIIEVFKNFGYWRSLFKDIDIRNYALTNLNYKNKLRKAGL